MAASSLVYPNLSTRIATIGPQQPEIMKLLPDMLAVPGMGGLSTGLSLEQSLTGDFGNFDAQVNLLLEYPQQKLRVGIHATPASKSRGYQFFTVTPSVSGKPSAPVDIAAMWGANLINDMCLGFANVHDHLHDLGLGAQIEGYYLGGSMSMIDDYEFTLCSSSHKPHQDFSSIVLASKPSAYTPQKVIDGQTLLASKVGALQPGMLLGMCFYMPNYLSLGGHFDGGAFAISILQSMHAAAFAAGCRMGVLYQSAKNGRPIPSVMTELAGACDGLLLQERQGFIYSDPVPDNALLIERHITDDRPSQETT